jgi:SAM-dependent methyltransferase
VERIDRTRTASRISLERALEPVLRGLPEGVVLDVGSKDAPYRRFVAATEYLAMEIAPGPGVDVVGDIHDIPKSDATFDTIICTEVLEHCHDPQRAVDEIGRVLRPGGVCVLSTRFLYPYHGAPKDYFRFTEDGLDHLFRGFSHVDVTPLGDRLESAWMLLPRRGRLWGRLVNVVDPLVASRRPHATKAPPGYLVRAVR